EMSGKSVAPSAKPAFNFTAILAAKPLPDKELERTITSAFSFSASAIYCFNDICDVEGDRLHPTKYKRPIASRMVSIKGAYTLMGFCFALAILMLFLFFHGNQRYLLLVLIGCYFALNIAYCIKLKSFAIIDVIIISIGFVLRIWIGGKATGIWLSEWIIIMTFLLALFLAFAKRRDDVVLYQQTGTLLRNHTNRYNLEFLNQVMTIISTITILAYIMFTLSPEVMMRFNNRNIYVTSIFVLMGIIRYLQVTIVDSKSGSPTNILLRDKFIQLCIAGWIVSFLILIYL
ncbi:MAG: prenyltransferase, partial [Chitinophagaceae bacterium]